MNRPSQNQLEALSALHGSPAFGVFHEYLKTELERDRNAVLDDQPGAADKHWTHVGECRRLREIVNVIESAPAALQEIRSRAPTSGAGR